MRWMMTLVLIQGARMVAALWPSTVSWSGDDSGSARPGIDSGREETVAT